MSKFDIALIVIFVGAIYALAKAFLFRESFIYFINSFSAVMIGVLVYVLIIQILRWTSGSSIEA